MKTRILIMRPGEPHETKEIELQPVYDGIMAALKPIFGDVPIEHVTVAADFSGGTNYKRADMFVDEMGHMRVSGPLPFNSAATAIYHRATQLRCPGTDMSDAPTIVGPAVLFEHIVWR